MRCICSCHSGVNQRVLGERRNKKDIRAAIGIGGRHVDHREILIEMGPLEALVKISDTRGPHPCRLDMLAMDRAALGPPAGPIALELCRNAEVVAQGRPVCPLCGQPMDPDGHFCPRANGHPRPSD